MALFKYKAVDPEGAERQGTIDAVNVDVAITALQRRNLILHRPGAVAEALRRFRFRSLLFR